MCLRFTFLLIMRVASWLRLSQREETWKTAEILILRHQLAVLQRQQPRRPNLNWADRAWHRDITRRRWAARSARGKTGRPASQPQEHQGTGDPAGPREPRMGIPQDSRRACRPGSEGSGVDGVGDSEEGRNPPRAAPGLASPQTRPGPP